ncbi:hypothetical protein CFC21_040454, partial [Triticum aestivum]
PAGSKEPRDQPDSPSVCANQAAAVEVRPRARLVWPVI